MEKTEELKIENTQPAESVVDPENKPEVQKFIKKLEEKERAGELDMKVVYEQYKNRIDEINKKFGENLNPIPYNNFLELISEFNVERQKWVDKINALLGKYKDPKDIPEKDKQELMAITNNSSKPLYKFILLHVIKDDKDNMKQEKLSEWKELDEETLNNIKIPDLNATAGDLMKLLNSLKEMFKNEKLVEELAKRMANLK
ncbi:MAG: hypothetical protein QW727_04295 [Candidatus Pacearchaeota archaeon]